VHDSCLSATIRSASHPGLPDIYTNPLLSD
jgi:hypothetical protein